MPSILLTIADTVFNGRYQVYNLSFSLNGVDYGEFTNMCPLFDI